MDKHLNLLKKLISCCDADGLSVRHEGLESELTELKREFSKILEDKLEFEEIADHLFDGLYISDGDGKTLFVNKAFTRISGVEKDQITGLNMRDIEKAGLFFKNPVTIEVIKNKKIINSIGESLVNHNKMLITGSPIFDADGNVKKVVVNNRAVTDLDEIKFQLENTQNKLKAFEKENHLKSFELKHLRKKRIAESAFIGECLALKNIKTLIEQVAPTDASVLITGGTGTGKEIVANEIVKNSPRNDKPFIKMNCSAIPENLLESELFGYEKGAFTGASKEGKPGLFEIANEGTLLLDEIGDMPMDLQCKILRVLQEQEIKRIGAHKPISVNVRIISATNKNIDQAARQGTFREDLLYRINVIPINLPPLAERSGDIRLLQQSFLAKYNKKYVKQLSLDEKTISILESYSWPGNIRELENVIERLVIIAPNTSAAYDMVLSMLQVETDAPADEFAKPYKDIVQDFERRLLIKALERFKTTTHAAKALQLDQSTIVKKKQRLGIS